MFSEYCPEAEQKTQQKPGTNGWLGNKEQSRFEGWVRGRIEKGRKGGRQPKGSFGFDAGMEGRFFVPRLSEPLSHQEIGPVWGADLVILTGDSGFGPFFSSSTQIDRDLKTKFGPATDKIWFGMQYARKEAGRRESVINACQNILVRRRCRRCG